MLSWFGTTKYSNATVDHNNFYAASNIWNRNIIQIIGSTLIYNSGSTLPYIIISMILSDMWFYELNNKFHNKITCHGLYLNPLWGILTSYYQIIFSLYFLGSLYIQTIYVEWWHSTSLLEITTQHICKSQLNIYVEVNTYVELWCQALMCHTTILHICWSQHEIMEITNVRGIVRNQH